MSGVPASPRSKKTRPASTGKRALSLVDWITALHQAPDPAGVMQTAVAGAASLAGTRAFVLRVERSGRGDHLLGWLGVDGRGKTTGSRWMELARAHDMESASPDLTGTVRTMRLSIGAGSEAATACCVAGAPRRATVDRPETIGPWRERFDLVEAIAFPISAGSEVSAVLVVETGRESDDEPEVLSEEEEQVALLATHAGHAWTVLRAGEAERRHRGQMATLRETARALSAAQSVAAGLSRATRAAGQTIGARGATLWLTEPEGRRVHLACVYGPDDEDENRARALELLPLAEACVFQRENPLVADASREPRLSPAARRLGPVAGVPVVALDRTRGALLVWGREGDGTSAEAPFVRDEQDLLSAYAALASSLVDQADLSERVAAAEHRLEETQEQVLRVRNLAHLGEVSVRMARETTGPVASIAGFARRVHRSLPDGDPNREYLEIVVREGERLERLVQEHLQFAALHRFHLGVASVNHILQEALQKSAPEVAKKRVRLLKKLSPEIPALLLDAEKISQVVTNALANALEGVSTGGCVKVETRIEREQVVIEFAHDGPPLAGDLLEHLFVPFATGGRNGPGLGLAVAQRIVRDHGGEIGVRREGDWGQVLSILLPVRGNEDRRQGGDRRNVGGDRRNRMAAV